MFVLDLFLAVMMICPRSVATSELVIDSCCFESFLVFFIFWGQKVQPVVVEMLRDVCSVH